MRTYRISPSLLNAFSGWLNADDLYNKFWGNSEQPAMTMDEFQAKQLAELLAYINRDPQPLNEAADRGTCLNEIIDCLIGAEPNPNVWWDKIEGNYIAERNGFRFHFDGDMVEELAHMMRNGIPQFHLSHVYQPQGMDYKVELHGFADYIFPTQIYDLKTTNKYDGEMYRDNWQRLVYPVVAIDSGDMIKCDTFGFLVMEMCQVKETGVLFAKQWKETYDVNLEEARAQIMEFITSVVVPQLNTWQGERLIPNQTIINYGEKDA